MTPGEGGCKPCNYTNIQCCGHHVAIGVSLYPSGQKEIPRRRIFMTIFKSRLFAALALSTALTAPALVVPMFTASPALAGEATHDFADLVAGEMERGGRGAGAKDALAVAEDERRYH